MKINKESFLNNSVRIDSKTGYKGVTLTTGQHRNKPYQARIRVDKRLIHLGYFETAKEAALAYDEAAIAYHKEDAKTNF
jgi:hypothetical protein